MSIPAKLILLLWFVSSTVLYAQQKEAIHWPIDTKLDSVMKVLTNPILTKGTATQHFRKQCEMLFAPTGYIVLVRLNQSEKWIPISQFLASRVPGSRYDFQSVKVIHFQDIKKIKEGGYMSQASIYFDVKRFEDHVPITKSISKVAIPLTQMPPASDYWQIYELRLIETTNRLSINPHP